VAHAQTRVIQLPDSLGANFLIGDSATLKATPEDYDPLLGVWHFRFQQRRQDGSYEPAFTGHWTFRKRAGLRPVIEDYWRRDGDGNSPWESGTSTYRAFNPARGLWEIQGITTNGGPWLWGLGWTDGTNKFLFQRHSATLIMRFKYHPVSGNQFAWRADMSADNGKTWNLDWWVMDVRRVGT
jgi:hypothetical protein